MTFKVAGDAEIMGEVFASFGLAMAAGVLMVFGVLVLLFGSFMQPITILASLPFTIGGVIIALLVTGRPMSMPVIIGMLMLMGIVTKNAIMLVDFAIEEIAHGVPRYVAIVDAGRKRARPIVMTTIAMVGGMLPSALAIGAGGDFRFADGYRRDGRLDRVHDVVAGVRAGGVHRGGRYGQLPVARLRPFRRRGRRGARRTIIPASAAPSRRLPNRSPCGSRGRVGNLSIDAFGDLFKVRSIAYKRKS